MLLLFSAAVLNAALPLRLLDPRWQLALLLSHLAVALQPSHMALRQRRDRIARFALIAALGFLLLIPLQVAATWAGIDALARTQSRQQDQATHTINQLRQAISSAVSTADLQARFKALKLPVSGALDSNLPFPQQQRKLLAGLQRSEDQIQARALAFGFNALGRRRGATPFDQEPPGSCWIKLGANRSALDRHPEAYIKKLHPDDPVG